MQIILISCLVAVTAAFPGRLSHYSQNTEANSLSQNSYNNLGDGYDSPQQPPHVSKHIYVHTAPEEPEEEPREILTSHAQKSYKVIFIRAPVYKTPKVSLITPQNNEEKTLIYVLSKKTDSSDLDVATPAPTTEPSKPEVYFIKYKTPEEALNAQQQIQAHYDALGGDTKLNDEVVAPIQSVIGAYSGKPSSSSAASSNLSQHNVYASIADLNAAASSYESSQV